MTQNFSQSPLSFEQILHLVQQLPTSDQIKLSQEIIKQNQASIQYRTQTFRDLLQEVEPINPDFDPDQAKADYLAQKYNL